MKKEIRKEILNKRKELSITDVENLSSRITRNILNWNNYNCSKNIMIYMPFRNEVDTKDIIKDSLLKGKGVILPKTIKETSLLLPCLIRDMGELIVGTYGIMEPDEKNIVDRDIIDIVFVPGVAFDAKGYRIGYGAGYYDRFLSGYNGIKAGICFEMQIIEDAYHDQHDIKMDYLITEHGIIKI